VGFQTTWRAVFYRLSHLRNSRARKRSSTLGPSVLSPFASSASFRAQAKNERPELAVDVSNSLGSIDLLISLISHNVSTIRCRPVCSDQNRIPPRCFGKENPCTMQRSMSLASATISSARMLVASSVIASRPVCFLRYLKSGNRRTQPPTFDQVVLTSSAWAVSARASRSALTIPTSFCPRTCRCRSRSHR